MRRLAVGLLLLAALPAAGCSGNGADVRVDGDGGLSAFVQEARERYSEGNHGSFSVDDGGADAAIERLCRGEVDVAAVARPLEADDLDRCAAGRVEPLQLAVANDPIAIVASPSVAWATCLSVDQLARIFGSGSQARAWRDVDPAFPDRELEVVAMPAGSGTHDTFVARVLDGSGSLRDEARLVDDEGEVLEAVAAAGSAVGIVPLAALRARDAPRVTVLGVDDDGAGCVVPSSETVADGSYQPLSHQAYLTVAQDALSKEAVQRYADYTLEHAWELARAVGLEPLGDQQRLEAKATFARASAVVRGAGRAATRPAVVGGPIVVEGSGTTGSVVVPIADAWKRARPGDQVTVADTSGGDAVARLCRGEIPIALSSRPIEEAEDLACTRNGVTALELVVANEAIVVVTGRRTPWLGCVTTDELRALWRPGSKVTRWPQVRAGLPDLPVRLYGPSRGGTFEYFTFAVNGESEAVRRDFEAVSFEDTVAGVARHAGALGYVPYVDYLKGRARVRPVAVDDAGGGCVLPEEEPVLADAYQPLARQLVAYVSAGAIARPEVEDFLRFVVLNGAAIAERVGVFRPNDEQRLEALSAIDAAAGR